MLISLMKSKIHRATITDANLNYVGSITIDKDLLDQCNMRENEEVHILNVNNGQRFITYIIEGERGSGVICVNGAAARLVAAGDIIIIVSYGLMSPEQADMFKPSIVFVDENNKTL
jgi:aspartate 1-decarboxylase